MTARPPYRWAAATGLLVLVVYLLTLAPTVTFWDAGELIAAASTLGIPHPPGTPLFVLLAHVWGAIIPFGDYAWRLNLLSACAASAASICWFLVAHDSVRRMAEAADDVAGERLALGAGVAAAALTAFGYTTWQNSTETEVYSVAMLLIAVVAWVAVRWRVMRESRRGQQLLLLALYLGAMSIGNHLLALLVGPALVALLVVESRRLPLADLTERAQEQSRVVLIGALWVLLIALGLGSTLLTVGAGFLAIIAVVYAVRNRQSTFVGLAVLIVVIGLTTYLFLLLRAQQDPVINEAAPSNWQALLGVIRRAQYPVRTPLDDPTILHGSTNPGRTLTILAYQLANYAQYFDWQWAKSIGPTVPTPPLRIVVTACFALAGCFGAVQQRRRDPSGFALMLTLFLITGLGLVIYMDFKPGPSIGWEQWTAIEDHEVRERDYFFVASFVAWGVWVAIGLAEAARRLVRRSGVARWSAGYAVLAISLVPMVANFRAASRRGVADETLARDFARALLQSVPPSGILFTFGDNDTFPLWHAQAVDGIRRDVTVVCLALAETPWYVRQLRSVSPEPVDQAQLAAVWRGGPAPAVSWPLHTMDDATINKFTPFLASEELTLTLRNGLEARVAKGAPIYGKDALVLEILRQNADRRPIAWSLTAAGTLFGLGPHLVMQGLALVLPVSPVDTSGWSSGMAQGRPQPRIDLETTRRLVTESWPLGSLPARGVEGLDPSTEAMAGALAIPMMQAGAAYYIRGDTTSAAGLLSLASRLTRDSTPVALLRVMRGRGTPPLQ